VDDEVGLILIEPILGEGGVVPLEASFVAAASELPPLLGFDEVQTGVGGPGRSSRSRSWACGRTS
jgi:acetylornithine/succinyldiaminopimelate/putrescine aminotransferase